MRAAAAAILSAVLLSACALPYDLRLPTRTTVPPATGAQADVAAPADRTADHARAAERLLSQADAAAGNAAHSYRLQAVRELILAGRLHEARRQLAMLDARGQPASFRVRMGLYEAQLALYDGQARAAMARLQQLEPLPALEAQVLAEWRWTRAQTLAALGRDIDAARELIERDRLLSGDTELARNRQELWNILDSADGTALRGERDATPDATLRAWIDLALIARSYSYNLQALAEQAAAWLRTYPGHPAGSIATMLGLPTTAAALDTSRVALLLPLTSRFADAANAVYRGFMAVHEANSDPARPLVTLYDIGADPTAAPLYYRQAVQAGARFVIGPLGLEAAQQVAHSGAVTVPTLLLAYVDGPDASAGAVYQFGLSPEDEARQVAQRAYLDGHRTSVMLYPASTWGERVRGAFVEEWEALGGLVAEAQPYQPAESDHSGPIKDLLNIEDSARRHALLENTLKTDLAFEPRRRHDASFLFMAADAQQGRLLNPQINFYRALDLPVYATSSIFSGRADPVYDTDLNGITFGDMPWMVSGDQRYAALRANLQHDWPGQHTQLDRLFALGMDAYRLMPRLEQLRGDPLSRISGVSGVLSVDRGGRVQRRLTWARFEKGLPVAVEPAPALPATQENAYGTEASGWPAQRPVGRGDGARPPAAPWPVPAGP